MKKSITWILALMLLLCACASAQVKHFGEYGFEMEITDAAANNGVTLYDDSDEDIIIVDIYYINDEVMAPAKEELDSVVLAGSDEEVEAARIKYDVIFLQNTAIYCSIIGVETEKAEKVIDQYPEEVKPIGSNGQYSYFVLPSDANEQLSSESAAKMEELRPLVEASLNSIKYFEPEESAAIESGFDSFTTVDMNGETVTEAVFAQADLTILNIWGTYCNPCISEMPELASWSKQLPENVRLVGLIVDVSSDKDKTYAKAQKILSKSGADFTNILFCEDFASLYASIPGTPTTLFIGRDGTQVAEPVLGANMAAYKETVEAFLTGK